LIVKHIENPKQESSKALRVGCLVDYIAADGKEAGDKAELVFAAGDFYAESWQAQRAEMIALAMEATRSADPVDHWLLSWKEGEAPTEAQCREAAGILKRKLGLGRGHLAMCALHRDTDNHHLHLVLNRVDPETLRVADKGWCIDKAHRAIAEIVSAQGWEPEANARYIYGNDGRLIRNSRSGSRQPRTRALDWENATGEKSCERIAIEKATPILAEAQSWAQVHSGLAHVGMRYEMKGSGAVIWVGDQPVKASAVGREFSKARMEDRLGVFEKDKRHSSAELPTVSPEPLRDMPPQWTRYRAMENDRRKQKDATVRSQRAAHREQRGALFVEFRNQRKALYDGGKWSGDALNVARSLLAADHARRKAELMERQRQERNELSKRFGRRVSYEQYLLRLGEDQAARDWRFRNSRIALGVISGEGEESVQERDIRDFVATIQRAANGRVSAIEYRHKNSAAQVSFRDRGRRIDVLGISDEAAVLAALQLATQKWGIVSVDGQAEFKLLCAELAASHGVRISNPEIHAQAADTLKENRTMRNVYEAHKADILKRMEARNPSQLDWMIAMRMRVTGHDETQIADILKSNAPAGRNAERRDWSRYAERTAAAVFGKRGDREWETNARRDHVWMRVEGREPVSTNPNTIERVRNRRERVRTRGGLELD
jgi:hypothetical protein